MLTTEEIKEKLNKDFATYCDMLNQLQRGKCKIVYAEEDGVCIGCENVGGIFLCAPFSVDGAKNMIKAVDGLKTEEKLFVVHGLKYNRYFCEYKGRSEEERTPCRQLYYGGDKIEETPVEGLEIKKIGTKYVSFLTENYSRSFGDREYMRDRLKSGVVYGAFYHGKIVGFIGRHDDGSMGMLEILPEFRRLGIGTALENKMVNVSLEEGYIPYGQMLTSSDLSQKFHSSRKDLVVSGEFVTWI